MSYESVKGYAAEHALEQYINDQGFIVWRPRTTSRKSADLGDLIGLPMVLSIKNHARIALATAVDEMQDMAKQRSAWGTGLLLHKRPRKGDPGQWYATTTVEMVMPLVKAYVIRRAIADP
jgi:hypothetical protein